MGLAASQARLLLLTARKDDVEAQLMSLSNARLSLTRESSEIADEYSNALNAQKLVWQANDGSDVDVTYNLLMRPNGSNDQDQYLLTNASNGKVILDDSYISTLGLNQVGGAGELANVMDKVGFLEKTMGIDEATATKYAKKGNSVLNKDFTTNYDDDQIISDAGLESTYSSNIQLTGVTNTIPDVNTAVSKFQDTLNGVSSSLDNAIKKELEGTLGYTYDSEIQAALDFAKTATYNKFVYGTTDGSSTGSAQINSVTDMSHGNQSVDNTDGHQADGSNELTYCAWRKYHGGFLGIGSGYGDTFGTVQVNGAQLIDTYLTFFDDYCSLNFGGSTPSMVGPNTTVRSGDGGTGNATAGIDNAALKNGSDDVNKDGISDAYEANFYLNMYDAINGAGWQDSSNIDNQSYLQSQILNGNVTLNKLEQNGWHTVSSGDSGSPMTSETDDATANKAEAKYQAESDKIEYQEKQMDLKMNDLDSERSAIQTEMDSVQKLIDKNIERGFKLFQNS